MARITLSDGRWLDMRPMYISDKVRILKVQERDEADTVTEAEYFDLVIEMVGVIEPGVTAKSWDGPITDITDTQLVTIARDWASMTEDDALPPESGTDSETK